MSKAQTIANLSATAVGHADALSRYLLVIKPDDPEAMRELLIRAFEALLHLLETMDAIKRLAPVSAEEGLQRALRTKEGLTI